jgi:cytochrome c oxidase subunit 2
MKLSRLCGVRQGTHTKAYLSVFFTVFLAGCANSPSTLDPHSAHAANVTQLTWDLFSIAGIVFLVVLLLLVLAFLRSRRFPAHAGEVVRFTDDRRVLTGVLFAGAVLPALILFGIMIWSISLTPASAAQNNGIVIEVTGHRWWWEIHYLNANFVSANEIHIPIGQPIALKLTSDDVNHSFWVPELSPKLDLIPGQTNTLTIQADATGTYRGQCAEFCGIQHAHMAFLVIADAPETYTRWVTQQQQPAPNPTEGLVLQGEQTFLGSACVYCHTIRGTNASGTLGPDLTHLASRQTIAAGMLPNTPGNLAGWIINSQSTKPGNLMPPMNLDADQVQALLAYLATLD